MKRIILDTDIGTDADDALALALAARSPEIELLGVTAVHADAPFRARIARRLLGLCDRGDVPVIPGASQPLQMPLPINFTGMPRLLGHEGVGILSEVELLQSVEPNATADDAAHFIIEQAASYPGEVSLVTIGPLTNIGRALQLEPRLAEWISDLTLMGGTVYTEDFRLPLWLETNLNADPEAARLVFAADIPRTIIPMEVTTQVFLTPEQRTEMLSWGSALATTLVTLMEKMFEGLSSLLAGIGLGEDFFQGRAFMHDPLAVCSAITHRYITVRRMHVAYEVIDNTVRTVPYSNRTPNCWVCVGVDAPKFVHFWLERIHGG